MDINRKNFRANSLACVALCLCVHVRAADGEYLDMELEQLLQVPVTGSTLRGESIKTVPAAVTVFTYDQIERMGIDYLYELLNFVPGYQFDRGADSGVNYTFSSRGRRNGSQAREVLVIVDGRSMTNPRTGSADITLPFIPLEQIERVEVIRGPGSAIYGSSAFSGVINIITRKHKNSVKVEIGGDDRRSLGVALTKPLGNWSTDIYLRAYEDSGQHYWVQDTFTRAPLRTQDPRQTVDLDVALAKENTQIHLAYHRVSTDDFYIIENTQNGFNSSSASLKQLSIEQGFTFWDGVATQVYLSYIAVDQSLNVPVIGAGALAKISEPASNEPLLTKGYLAGEGYNVRVTNSWDTGENSNALVGVEWKQETETDAYIKNNYDLGQLVQGDLPINYYGDFSHSTPLGLKDSYQSMGVYGQYQRALGKSTDLTLGLRYDNYDDLGKHVSPRLGLVHQLNPAQIIKLLYGEAYRAPSLAEMGIINNPLLVGNPNLDYESVKTWDLIWIGTWGNTILSVGGFRNYYKGPIVAGLIGTTRTFVNSADEFSDGITFAGKYFLTPEWSLRAIYTNYLNLPKTAFREAKELTSFEVNFNHGVWNWNLLTYHHSARYTLGDNSSLHKLDDFWVFNSKVRYQFRKDYTLSVQFKNLTDLDYATPAQGAKISQGVPNRGREISAVVDWAF